MASGRLLLRVGVPFVLSVLLAQLALAFTLGGLIDAADRHAFEDLAVQNASFIDRSSLAMSERLVEDLRRVTSQQVFVRTHGVLRPMAPREFAAVPLATMVATGGAVVIGDHEVVGVSVGDKGELFFVREARRALFGAPVLSVLAASLSLTAFAAWWVVRGVVRPLRNLARQLPQIDRPDAKELPEAARPDEIGDLARAFVGTREALREAQESRQRVEKLAVLGRMTASLAHEVQNPIAAIRMHAQLWRDADAHPSARTIEQEAARIEGMLNQWLFLTRPEPPARTPLEIGARLRAVVEAQRSRAEHAAVVVTLDAEPDLVVAGDGRRLDQVFHNLLTNALQAMPGGGVLRVTARRHAGGVLVDFADSGRGFSPEALRRFAEFFFSEREGGMGIGLSVATEIVRAHVGRLDAENLAAGGAVVRVWLPAEERVA